MVAYDSFYQGFEMNQTDTWQLRLREWVYRSCVMEVMSPKPGNVSPGHEFPDATVDDFLKSAEAIALKLSQAPNRSTGLSVLRSVEATRQRVQHNTNLGIVLLIAPLAAVPEGVPLRDGIGDVLRRTTVEDSRLVYQAIRTARPAGLGEATEQDVHAEPTVRLQECMALAAKRDRIAAQYAFDFQDVLELGLNWLMTDKGHGDSQQDQITWLAVRLMAEFGDSLIGRKCGEQMSDQVKWKAQRLLKLKTQEASSHTPAVLAHLSDFDRFLRADGNRRNPGTTADLVAAVLFAAQRENLFRPDNSWPFDSN